MTRARDEAGFSLIEVLVALAVIATMTGLLFETLTRNVRFAAEMARRRDAVLLTQSLLAEVRAASPGAGLEDEGRRGALAWRIDRRAERREARDDRPPLQEIRIRVSDTASGRLLTSVQTLRLAQ